MNRRGPFLTRTVPLHFQETAMEKSEGDLFQAPERAVGKRKVRLVPEWYILPRRSIPRTIALYSFLTAAGVGAGMLVEAWIKQQVENDTAVLWRKDEGVGRNSDPDPSAKP